MSYTAVLISVLALLFTVYSFWWMSWRRGRLYVSSLKHCSIFCSESKLYIQLPIVFYNSGALAIVVESLRLRFAHENTNVNTIHFNAILQKFESDEGRYFAIPFPIQQREAKQVICEFQRNPSEIKFEAKNYKLILEGKLLHKKKWLELTRFNISISINKLSGISQHLTTLESLK